MEKKKKFNNSLLKLLKLNLNINYSKDFIKYHLIKSLEYKNNKYILSDSIKNMIKTLPLKESEGKLKIGDVINLIPYWKNIWNDGIKDIDQIIDLFYDKNDKLDFFNKGEKVKYIVI